MWDEEDGISNGSSTPPLPTRAPAPPPPAFVRSHSLGKTETKLSFHGQEDTVAQNLLAGRHTHHYPTVKGSEQFSKVRLFPLFVLTRFLKLRVIFCSQD